MYTDVKAAYENISRQFEDSNAFTVHTAENKMSHGLQLIAANGSPLVIGLYENLATNDDFKVVGQNCYALLAVPDHSRSLNHRIAISQSVQCPHTARLQEIDYDPYFDGEADFPYPIVDRMITQPELADVMSAYVDGAVLMHPDYMVSYRSLALMDHPLNRMREYGRLMVQSTSADDMIGKVQL